MPKTLSELLDEESMLKEEASLFESNATEVKKKMQSQVFFIKPKKFLSQVLMKQKIIVFRASFFKWRQNLLLITFFVVDDENKVDQSLIFFFHFWSPVTFAEQNDKLRLKSSRAASEAPQMIFP